jgi:hypothetical protein
MFDSTIESCLCLCYTHTHTHTHVPFVSTCLFKDALEDLAAFSTPNIEQQRVIVRELFINVLEAKPRARKAIGHLLETALNREILSNKAFLAG